MKTITLKTESQVIEVRTLLEGTTKDIIVHKFYDLNGQIINEGTDVKSYEVAKKFKIIEKKIQMNWKYSEPDVFTEWEVYVDGRRFGRDYEITAYNFKNKAQLVLQGCVGAG